MSQYYEIRLKGHFGRFWLDWLADMTIIHKDNGETLLIGPVAD